MQGSALSAIFKSRKGLAAVIVTLFVLAIFIAEAIAAATGKMTFAALKDEAKTYEAILGGVWGLYILGTAHEDAAEKAAGGDPSATKTS